MKEPFRICIRDSYGRETELIPLSFNTESEFQDWLVKTKENLPKYPFLLEGDLDIFQRKAKEHFS